ncbi:hypothetical protein HUT18_29035 [Streptomyces sp. NA04227]|uniref:hypothetical protein n=1 Tax=Streptomyces sp. NA04227 TaxID=2742136 RepID=UPI0015900748|nr:hypothetical protein [Streptomyces sp. NA04227]QKW09853.1 hypothetical protein HUT18_29035 [Streptomyces sp. NA04227]
MTTPQNPRRANPPVQNETSPPPEPFLSLHSAVILLAGLVIGLVIGCLTVLGGASVAVAVIAGLTSAGASIPVLRTLIW